MDINAIILKIDEFLEKTGKKSTDPVEANEMLEKAGLLNDSDTRKGKPLRELLRRGLIRHAYQPGGPRSSWVIPHSSNSAGNETPIIKKSPEVKPVVTLKKPITSSYLEIDFNDIENIKKHGFLGFQSIGSLYEKPSSITKQMGIYMVLNISQKEPKFLEKGSGGFFKDKDPNVSIKILEEHWVKNSLVVYIGKAGSKNGSATLRSRLIQYLKFGHGKNVGHYGGRFIWQISNPEHLVLCWKPLSEIEPREEEVLLIKAFFNQFGKRPFANLTD
jgi:hypothetical protein